MRRNQAMKLTTPAKGVMDFGVEESLTWPEPESGAKSMSTFCAAGGVWNVFTNSHTTVLAAQNASIQSRRSGSKVLRKAKIWDRINQGPVNERQRAIINRLMDDFVSKLTTSKYAKLAKCSEDTALRDIRALMDRGIIVQNEGGGRSTSYTLVKLI